MSLHKKKPMAAALCLALALCFALQPAALAAGTRTYPDVKQGFWYYDYVTKLSADGIINGLPDGTFNPGGNVTTGEAMKLLILAAGYPAQSATGANWASGYAAFAVKNGFMSSDEAYNYNTPISRLSVAKLAGKALGLVASGAESPFGDISNGYATALYEKQIMIGSLDTGTRLLNPSSSITRAEISAIVWRAQQYKQQTDAKYINFAGRKFEVMNSVPVSTYTASGFSKDDSGIMNYTASGVTAKHGIDVSHYQGDIDWNKVKASGVDFAIIRVGGRYADGGKLYDDPKFQQNIKGATAAGLDVGVYFFSQAITTAEAKEEADYLLSKISGYQINGPIVYDWEHVTLSSGTARTYGLDTSILTQCAKTFCERVKAAGYSPMVYFNCNVGYLYYDLRQLTDYPFWLAQYGVSAPNFYYNYAMWQYGTGTVDGISGEVDLDLLFVK